MGVLQTVRDDALDLLNMVSSRVWKDNGQAAASVRPGTPLLHGGLSREECGAAVIIGNLQDSYQVFQLQLSVTLSRSILLPLVSIPEQLFLIQICRKEFPNWLDHLLCQTNSKGLHLQAISIHSVPLQEPLQAF